MIKTEITFDLKSLDKQLENILLGVNRFTIQMAALAQDNLNQTTQYKDRTGNLRNTTTATAVSNIITLKAIQEYASMVEYGRPEIVATGKALRFEIDGQVLFRKRVKAAAPRPFIADAMKMIEENSQLLFNEIMQQYK